MHPKPPAAKTQPDIHATWFSSGPGSTICQRRVATIPRLPACTMLLIRWGAPGAEHTGVMIDGVRKDTSSQFSEWSPAFFRGDGMARLRALIASGVALPDVPQYARWAACIPRPGKVVCIGLNYTDHAAEVGAKLPKEPIVFLKGTNTVVGPYDDVLIPRHSVKTDWEVELGVVIGSKARYVSEAEALKYVAGYCVVNDLSEREYQLERGGTWDKGKGCDTFGPVGP